MRHLALLALVLSATISAAQCPFPPTKLNPPAQIPLGLLAKDLRDRTGLSLDFRDISPETPLRLAPGSLWELLDQVAQQTGHRLQFPKKGAAFRLIPATAGPVLASYDGPFRLAIRQVSNRHDFELGLKQTEVAIDLHWEPRYPVFRIESEPQLTTATTDSGKKLEFTPNRTKIPLVGASHQSVIRLNGIDRSQSSLHLSGRYTVTAAEKMLSLPFRLADGAKTQTAEGIAVALRKVEVIENRLELQVDMEYPKDHPEFESFETFVTQNTAILSHVNGRNLEPSDFEINSQGRRVTAVYRYVAKPGTPPWDAKAWNLTYRTPGPLKEFTVTFDWAKIPLP